MSRGRTTEAIGFAVRAVTMIPLDENHHALLIRLYRLAGEHRAADRQYAACVATFDRELGTAPGSAVDAAMRERPPHGEPLADDASIDAVVEAGAAAIAAGAVEAGIASVRTAVRLADGSGRTRLRVHARLVLAEALVHALGGLDEEGLAMLFEADDIALADGDLEAVARARAELGYVDFLRARYDRAEVRLTEASELADGAPSMVAKVTTYLGSVASDRADYGRAAGLLGEGIARSRAVAEPRREAYGLAMLGRLHLLRGDLEQAASTLDASIAVTERDHWLAFLPWPQAMRGQVRLAMGDAAGAAALLRQAFARACQLGDPCWEGMAAHGLALLAEAGGEPDRAFAVLADARVRCRRHADPYVWLDGYILDAQCDLGRRHHHPDRARWVDALRDLASRTGMRELLVRALVHGATLGTAGDAAAAALLAAAIDNPVLPALVRAVGPGSPQYVRRT
jgi:tetratricopeptide (TPR) repeat protein